GGGDGASSLPSLRRTHVPRTRPRRRRGLGHTLCHGQIDPYQRALLRAVLEVKTAAIVTDNAVDGRESQPAMTRFGAEERLDQDALAGIGTKATTRIRHADLDMGAGTSLAEQSQGVSAGQFHRARREDDSARGADRVAG